MTWSTVASAGSGAGGATRATSALMPPPRSPSSPPASNGHQEALAARVSGAGARWSRASSSSGRSGRRTEPDASPMRASAAFAGTGFGAPRKFASMSGSHRSWIRRARAQSPVRAAAQSATISPGSRSMRPRRHHRRRGRGSATSTHRRRRGRPRSRPLPADPCDLLQVPRGFLDRHDPRVRGKPEERVRLHVRARARRDVVDDHGQATVVRHRPEMALEHALVRAVVVRRHDEGRVRAELGGPARARIVASVSFVPVPATTMTRRPAGRVAATSTVISISRSRSAWLRVGASPVVPHGTKPSMPERTCQHARRRKADSSRAPSSVNGVTSAVRARRWEGRIRRGRNGAAGVAGERCHWELLSNGRREIVGRSGGRTSSGAGSRRQLAARTSVASPTSSTASNGWRPAGRVRRAASRPPRRRRMRTRYGRAAVNVSSIVSPGPSKPTR